MVSLQVDHNTMLMLTTQVVGKGSGMVPTTTAEQVPDAQRPWVIISSVQLGANSLSHC